MLGPRPESSQAKLASDPIADWELHVYRPHVDGKTWDELGNALVTAFTIQVRDHFKLNATSGEPVFFSLFAVNPDGSVQRLFPRENQPLPSDPAAVLTYPPAVDRYVTLIDPGPTAFVLLASRTPIDNATIIADALDAAAWRTSRPKATAAYDGRNVVPSSAAGRREHPRPQAVRGSLREAQSSPRSGRHPRRDFRCQVGVSHFQAHCIRPTRRVLQERERKAGSSCHAHPPGAVPWRVLMPRPPPQPPLCKGGIIDPLARALLPPLARGGLGGWSGTPPAPTAVPMANRSWGLFGRRFNPSENRANPRSNMQTRSPSAARLGFVAPALGAISAIRR